LYSLPLMLIGVRLLSILQTEILDARFAEALTTTLMNRV